MWVLGLSRAGLEDTPDLLTPLLRGTSSFKEMQIDFRQFCLSETPNFRLIPWMWVLLYDLLVKSTDSETQ